MDPPRRPGSGWLQNADRNNKNQPSLAPTPDRSKVTRTIPLPAELVARNEGASEEEEEARKAEREKKAREDQAEEEEELCAICYDKLPNVGRGIIACGHVFCFSCIHQWTKSANRCPGCRVVVRRIIKTMSTADLVKEEARRQRDNRRRFHNKKQRKRAQRRAARIKRPVPGVVTKCFRVRPKSLKPTPAQQRAAPHPEAPGGFLHAEAQAEREAARQRREERQEQQRQLQQQQQQARVMQPVQARGALAALAETIRAADAADVTDESDADDVPPEEVEPVVGVARDSTAPGGSALGGHVGRAAAGAEAQRRAHRAAARARRLEEEEEEQEEEGGEEEEEEQEEEEEEEEQEGEDM